MIHTIIKPNKEVEIRLSVQSSALLAFICDRLEAMAIMTDLSFSMPLDSHLSYIRGTRTPIFDPEFLDLLFVQLKLN